MTRYEAASRTALGTLLLASCIPSAFKEPPSVPDDSAMASVRGVPQFVVDDVLKMYNAFKGGGVIQMASIDVDNFQFTCSGETASIMGHFISRVRQKMAAAQGASSDQSAIAFHKRKPDATVEFHPHIHAPWHCGKISETAVEQHMAYAAAKGWLFSANDCGESLVCAATGGSNVLADLHGMDDLELTRTVAEYIYTQQVDWPGTLLSHKQLVCRIVDYAPSGGPMPLHEQTVLSLQGRGIELTKSCDDDEEPSESCKSWADLFRSRVDSSGMVHTRLTDLIGLPPVIIGATAPTTRSVEFVAAVAQAGYHGELSIEDTLCGDELTSRITRLADTIPPGQGITVSCRGSSDEQRQRWQLRTIAHLRQTTKLPIIGVVANQGISGADITMLERAGIRYVALQVTTETEIDHALAIAQLCANFPIVVQWTGGRCGGVHSMEEFHIPLIITGYKKLRAQSNIVLVANSGFGNAAGIQPYLDGSWGEMFNRPLMPFDGVMLGSRIMVALESPLADAAKQLIVSKATGVDPYDMLALFGDAPAGGVVSIRNEHGQPVHVVANRAALFCHRLSTEVLLHTGDKLTGALQANRAWIVRELCTDYMRPWFGHIPSDDEHKYVELGDMTYMQVIDRLVELLYVSEEQRWIHPTYRNLVAKFVRRSTERLHNTEQAFDIACKQRVVYDDAVFDEIATVRLAYPDVHVQLLASEDIQYLVSLCKRPGQKAVPFVPVLDSSDFADFLMRDFEWQGEDLCSVHCDLLDEAAQRVLICQGPVSAQYSTVANEPVKDIIDGIYKGLAMEAAVDDGICLEQPEDMILEHTVVTFNSQCERTYQLPKDGSSEGLPSLDKWIRALAGCSSNTGSNWLYCLLESPVVVQGRRYADNYTSRLMRPRYGRTVTVISDKQIPQSVHMWHGSTLELLIRISRDGRSIELSLPHRSTSLLLKYEYCPETPAAPIHETMHGRDDRITEFFAEIWRNGTDQQTPAVATRTSDNLMPHMYIQRNVPISQAMSLDQLAIDALPGVFGILTDGCVSAGLLGMVQTEYEVSKCSEAFSALRKGDSIDIVSRVDEISNVPRMGKQVVAVSDVLVSGAGEKCAEIRATFMFLNTPQPLHGFRHTNGPTMTILDVASDTLKVLESKEWFYYTGNTRAQAGDTLEFHLRSEYLLTSSGAYSHAMTKGSVYLVQGLHKRPHIADIDYEEGTSLGNAVLAFLDTHKQQDYRSTVRDFDEQAQSVVAFDTLMVPSWEAQAFATRSGDHNPHNTSQLFADLAGFPEGLPVMQGLWTCSAVRQLVDRHVAQGDSARMRSFRAQLTGPVYPGDRLETQLVHRGMQGGMLSIGTTTRNAATGEPVLECTALVAQPRTVYVFTGQGSQEVGMGLEWCTRSAVVRQVYERADRHMRQRFGFSIVDIIRDNPTEYTVYFNNDAAGTRIRENYAQFPEIAKTQERSYTFRAPGGLLHATQFAQPAIMLFDVAMAAEMRARGVFAEDALVAGHSLGEYGALAALGIMTLEDIIDITFIRGMTMQSVVERDARGCSDFALVAANPSRVSKAFTENSLQQVIGAIHTAAANSSSKDGLLLEIVNYNVQGHQYVVAGTRRLLYALSGVLDHIHYKRISMAGPVGKKAVADKAAALLAAITGTEPGQVELTRGRATIPIPGIDVPFHSSHLLPGAAQFRDCINRMIHETNVDTASLVGQYIPNLTAVPFQVTRAYFELMYDTTHSPVIQAELSKWPSSEPAVFTKKEMSRLARLLVIELLSYQFASPVQWIETQRRLFCELGAKRVIEIGPNSTLCRMAEGSLALLGLDTQVSVRHVLANEDDVFYQYHAADSNQPETEVAVVEQPQEAEEAEEEQMSETDVASTITNLDDNTQPVDDVPLTALAVIRAIVAQKLKVPLTEISGTQTVRELTGGKSTLQNEILGDLLKEFASGDLSTKSTMDLMALMPQDQQPDELTLVQLAQTLGASFSGTQLSGKHTMMQVARLFSTKMPGAFSLSAFRAALTDRFCGLNRRSMQDGVLLTAITMEPASRLDGIPAAHAWLRNVVKTYAEASDTPFQSLLLVSSSKAFDNKNGEEQNKRSSHTDSVGQKALATQVMEAQARFLGIDLRQGHRLNEASALRISELEHQVSELHDELGSDFVAGIRPLFDTRKVRICDSFWNWAREDALSLVLSSERRELDQASSRALMLANRSDDALIGYLTALASATDNDNDKDRVQRIRDQCLAARDSPPVYRETNSPQFSQYVARISAATDKHPPLVHLRQKNRATHMWEYSAEQSSILHACLRQATTNQEGVTFAGRTALISGCSKGSIGAHVMQRLLSGGARVVATTSSYNSTSLKFYESMYKTYGARGSALVVVPFNQASIQDIRGLVDYIYTQLGWHRLDYVLPFAAPSEVGTDVSMLSGESELALRTMLTNVLRLVGEVRRHNKDGHRDGQAATLVVVPMSPNHGVFGHDGLYGEAKAALETVFNRWRSELWHPHVAVAGAIIGWTRSTGLMAANDPVAPLIEINGACSFSAEETAANIVALMHPRIVDLAQQAPVWADLNGGLQRIPDVGDVVVRARQQLQDAARMRRAITSGYASDASVCYGPALAALHSDYSVRPMFNHSPRFPSPSGLLDSRLQGMANLDQVVVITGYGEVGPYGNAETRWEMEALGEFSLEGCTELAWIMGLIKHNENGGWVDSASGSAVADDQIKVRYEQQILDHTGIRLLEPSELEGTAADPAAVPVMRELQIDHDLEPFEASADEAAAFKLRCGDTVDVWQTSAGDDGAWAVRFRKGAVLMVPKALRFDRLVAAQLPTGWRPERYGVPKEIVAQVDPVTCYALVATAEALVRSGFRDAYELYRHFHVTQVGSSLGSGAGGVHSIRDLYRNRLMDMPVQGDILQETFANTTIAWINMLLLSSSGAIRPPTGGCATAALSIDVAADTIRSGKARVMVAGGFEGFVDQGSYEFAQMGATGSSIADAAAGRSPRGMSRPCTSTRTGFVEAQGAGVVILMSASAALECGAPVYAVLAHSASATDKQGVSLPAPGKGIMTTAAQQQNSITDLPILDLDYRCQQLAAANSAIDALASATSPSMVAPHIATMQRAAVDAWGCDFWRSHRSDISPLRGSLSAWGLTIDDIGLASMHATGTVANDMTETHVLDRQMAHLGRSRGLPVPAVAQKWLTGHPKGPAVAWMLISAIQSMRDSIVPGNRNADNIDKRLQCEYVLFPSRSHRVPHIKACLLKSFGFGQVGAELLVIHPDYFLSTLSDDQRVEYSAKVAKRNRGAFRYWQDTFTGIHSFVQTKNKPPYSADKEESVLLDPLARAHYDPATNEYVF
ncbi:fatty acid synthase alpha subunit Lsd1 [Coemansia sp. RSA 1933]|nr:fatty acid synthase alpha subunit Lsd1 [Coemansia sp. RSA 1933]